MRRDLEIVLKTKNAFSNGFSELGKGVKSVSEKIKGLFDIGAKPVLVIAAGVMALKKAFDLVEEGFRGIGRTFREIATERMVKSFDSLRDSLSQVTVAAALNTERFNGTNKIYEQHAKSIRTVEDAQNALNKSIRMAGAVTQDSKNVVENESDALKINLEAKRKTIDLEKEIENGKKSSNLKRVTANDMEVESIRLSQEILKARERAAKLGGKQKSLLEGTTGAAGLTGWNKKELESLATAQKASTDLANKAADEKERLDAQIKSLRLQSIIDLRIASEKEFEVRSIELQRQSSMIDLETKIKEQKRAAAEKNWKEQSDELDREKEIRKTKAQIAEAEHDDFIRATEKKVKDQKDRLVLLRNIAEMTVAEYLAEKDKTKQKDSVTFSEDKKRNRLMTLGALSKKDKEWLDAKKEIDEAKGDVKKLFPKIMEQQNQIDQNLAREADKATIELNKKLEQLVIQR